MNLLKRMKQYLQIGDGTEESGGILLGFVCRDSFDLLITKMTEPYEEDVSNRYSFTRKSLEHIKVYNEMYESSNKTCLYVGEWHTHAEDMPAFSKVDSDNWRTISRKAKDSSMQIHVIAGTRAVRFWAVCKEAEPVLLDTVIWDEVDFD
ncbi:MAG: Mov34/MPN/PAD-1 family protein [Selenomonadaceae bacterium]|nr:Mov34/MPN/PAD-1 family protein [Selenomonadaceae bacterium]